MNSHVCLDVFKLVLSEYALPPNGIHGIRHWARVCANVRRLAETSRANIVVAELFALLHDSKRCNEGIDRDHGRRAADFVLKLRRGILSGLSDAESGKLSYACMHHNEAIYSADPTIQTCWDSDRLDLPRVGKEVNTEYLLTDAAARPEIITWARQRSLGNIEETAILCEWGWKKG